LKITSQINRNRLVYAVLVLVTILLGLASRKFAWLLPALLKKNAGDILWATMVFFLVGNVRPRVSTLRAAAISEVFSVFIEFFKRFHSPLLDTVRATILGRLVFGYEFSWSNLACYTVGIMLGALVEVSVVNRKHDRDISG